MSRKHYLFFAAIVSLCGVGAMGWSMSDWFWLPNPKSATQPQLLRWLVLRDVSELSVKTQLVLVERFEAELNEGIDTSGTSQLSDRYLNQLLDNIEHLKEVWFTTRCRQYQITEHSQKADFVAARLTTIWNWAKLNVQTKQDATEESAMQFFDNIETWVEKADPADRTRMETAVRDGFIYWLSHHELELSVQSKSDLARRIVRELDRGPSKELTPFSLSLNQIQRLRRNFLELLETWFHQKALEYQKVPGSQRDRFVDGILDQVVKWDLGRTWSELGASAQLGPRAALGELDVWIKRAPGDAKPRLRQLGKALHQRAIWRWAAGQSIAR